jgi:hypothetical protein
VLKLDVDPERAVNASRLPRLDVRVANEWRALRNLLNPSEAVNELFDVLKEREKELSAKRMRPC